MIDIGVGYYRKTSTRNAFDATWYSSRLDRKEIGRGIVKGDTSNGFPGNYIVTYFYPDGSEAGTFDLKIEKTGSIYDLSWSRDGELLYIGVGIETSDGMAIGYRKIEYRKQRENIEVS